MLVPEIDRQLGIEVYASDTPGIGGVIRRSVEDFVVEEVLVDGSRACIDGKVEKPALNASRDRQDFLLCVLVKKNWDTFAALKNIARQLGVKPSQLSIAGIKDAKAVTAQHITIEHSSIEKARGINVKDVQILPLGYFRDSLSPYYLFGNNFCITITEINLSAFTVEKRVAETVKAIMALGGIPNFFGHQRFGTVRPITHLVGKALVQGDIEEAVMLFLTEPSAYEHPASRQARCQLRESCDFRQALQYFPVQLRYERLLLRHLADNPRDFIGAFRCLPDKLQALFVQAYQSYLFNRFLSERLRRGLALNKAEVGDYVVNVERSGLPMVNTGRLVDECGLTEVNDAIKAGKMRVALPLVGVKQRLSQGVMGAVERQILEDEGVNVADFALTALPVIREKGGLRSVISPVLNLKFNNLQNSRLTLEFMLLRGSYATIFLREIMKPKNPVKAGF